MPAPEGSPKPVSVSSAPSKPDSTIPGASTGFVSSFQERNPRYRIRPGDVLDLNFEFSPEFNQTVAVQPDGFVSLRGGGEVIVAGQSVPQVTQSFKNAFSGILNKPVINVVLKDFEKPYFVVDGQVGHPGKYELRGDTSVAEAIGIAGGFTESSKHSQVLLFRRSSNTWLQAQVLDLKKMLNDRNIEEDVHLRPGDLIYVPQNAMSKIRRYFPTPGVGLVPTF
jgi:polysaccharide export outer membrane protein